MGRRSSPSEPIPLVTQLETLAEEMGTTVDTNVMEKLLLGEFREMYYWRDYVSILDAYEELNENYGISFDADGTAIEHHLGETADTTLNYYVALSDGKVFIQLFSAETGALYDTWILVFRENMVIDSSSDTYGLLKDKCYLVRLDENNNYYFYSKEWEASEELAPALTDVFEDEFDGEWLYVGATIMWALCLQIKTSKYSAYDF